MGWSIGALGQETGAGASTRSGSLSSGGLVHRFEKRIFLIRLHRPKVAALQT